MTVSAAGLVVRWERLAMMYEAFCILACIIICLREQKWLLPSGGVGGKARGGGESPSETHGELYFRALGLGTVTQGKGPGSFWEQGP